MRTLNMTHGSLKGDAFSKPCFVPNIEEGQELENAFRTFMLDPHCSYSRKHRLKRRGRGRRGQQLCSKKGCRKKTVSQLPRSKIRLTVPCCDLFIYQDNCCNPLAGLQSLLHPFSGNKKTVRLVAQAKHC